MIELMAWLLQLSCSCQPWCACHNTRRHCDNARVIQGVCQHTFVLLLWQSRPLQAAWAGVWGRAVLTAVLEAVSVRCMGVLLASVFWLADLVGSPFVLIYSTTYAVLRYTPWSQPVAASSSAGVAKRVESPYPLVSCTLLCRDALSCSVCSNIHVHTHPTHNL
jgi:hypothetical protein